MEAVGGARTQSVSYNRASLVVAGSCRTGVINLGTATSLRNLPTSLTPPVNLVGRLLLSLDHEVPASGLRHS